MEGRAVSEMQRTDFASDIASDIAKEFSCLNCEIARLREESERLRFTSKEDAWVIARQHTRLAAAEKVIETARDTIERHGGENVYPILAEWDKSRETP